MLAGAGSQVFISRALRCLNAFALSSDRGVLWSSGSLQLFQGYRPGSSKGIQGSRKQPCGAIAASQRYQNASKGQGLGRAPDRWHWLGRVRARTDRLRLRRRLRSSQSATRAAGCCRCVLRSHRRGTGRRAWRIQLPAGRLSSIPPAQASCDAGPSGSKLQSPVSLDRIRRA